MNIKEEILFQNQLRINELKRLTKPQILKALNDLQYPEGSVGDNYKVRGTFIVEAGKLIMNNTIEKTIEILSEIQ